MDAVHDALEHELEDDPSVFLAGIDVGAGGNVFAITRGLWERWPDRVRDTPISETASIGMAVGAAMVGMRPVVEIMYLDFIGVCLDQLLNQAAKLRYMSGGAVTLPLVVRTQFGSGRSSGSQHSQSLEALLAHIPGLTVVMPSTAADAYGLLACRHPAIPTRSSSSRTGCSTGARSRESVATTSYRSARARSSGRGRDLTIVTMSRMVHEALAAADELERAGIDAEVIDLRTISPLDWPLVRSSLDKTGRLLIAHDAVTDFGVGAEIAARAADDGVLEPRRSGSPRRRAIHPGAVRSRARTRVGAWVSSDRRRGPRTHRSLTPGVTAGSPTTMVCDAFSASISSAPKPASSSTSAVC